MTDVAALEALWVCASRGYARVAAVGVLVASVSSTTDVLWPRPGTAGGQAPVKNRSTTPMSAEGAGAPLSGR